MTDFFFFFQMTFFDKKSNFSTYSKFRMCFSNLRFPNSPKIEKFFLFGICFVNEIFCSYNYLEL